MLTSFIVVSGMVVAELISPWFSELLGISLDAQSLNIWLQIAMVIIIVLPVGILAVILPVKSYVNQIKKNITHLSHRIY